jgi:hypothetical protein
LKPSLQKLILIDIIINLDIDPVFSVERFA